MCYSSPVNTAVPWKKPQQSKTKKGKKKTSEKCHKGMEPQGEPISVWAREIQTLPRQWGPLWVSGKACRAEILKNSVAFIRLSHPIGQSSIKYCIWMLLFILCGFFCFFVSGWRVSYLILEKGERKRTCFYSRSYRHIGISSCIAESFVSDRYNYIEDVRLHR